MSTPWTPAGEPAPIGHASSNVMVVDGQAFLLSDGKGDVAPGTTHGFFVGDTRFLDRAQLFVNGRPLELLARDQPDAFAATIVLRPKTEDGLPSRDVLVVRRRYLGLGLREDIELRNYSTGELPVVVTLKVSADFADLFAVKDGRAGPSEHVRVEVPEGIRLQAAGNGVHRDDGAHVPRRRRRGPRRRGHLDVRCPGSQHHGALLGRHGLPRRHLPLAPHELRRPTRADGAGVAGKVVGRGSPDPHHPE